MPGITPITLPPQLHQDIVSSPDHVARLQQQMGAVILIDTAGRLLAVKTH